MDEGVDDDFAEDVDGDAPDVLAADSGEVGAAHGVFFEEEHDFLHSFGKRLLNVDVIEDVGFVITDEAPALDPCIVEVLAAVETVKDDAALAGDETALFRNKDAEALQHAFVHFPAALEVALDGLEVEGFDGESRHGEGVEADTGDAVLEFCDELGVGLAVGGAEADVGALFDAIRLDEMGTGAAEKHLDDEQGFPIEGGEFDVRHQARRDGIGNEVGDALLMIEGIFHADDLAVIRDAENQFSPCGVGEGHQGLEPRAWRR